MSSSLGCPSISGRTKTPDQSLDGGNVKLGSQYAAIGSLWKTTLEWVWKFGFVVLCYVSLIVYDKKTTTFKIHADCLLQQSR